MIEAQETQFSSNNSLEYSACLEDSIEGSILTRSIGNRSSASSAASCKSIGDAAVLLAQARGALKTAAHCLTSATGDKSEYWDTWRYWHRHPFIQRDPTISGQLLLEHLMVLLNVKQSSSKGLDVSSALLSDLKDWLQTTGVEHLPSHLPLCGQLCTAYFIFYLDGEMRERIESSLNLLKEFLLPIGLLETLQHEIQVKYGASIAETSKSSPKTKISSFSSIQNQIFQLLAFLQEFAQKVLIQLKEKYGLIAHLIQTQPDIFAKFCKKLFLALVQRLKEAFRI